MMMLEMEPVGVVLALGIGVEFHLRGIEAVVDLEWGTLLDVSDLNTEQVEVPVYRRVDNKALFVLDTEGVVGSLRWVLRRWWW